MPDGPVGPFTLRFPAAPRHAATARLFVVSLARALGIDEATVEDLKLAVSEATAAAIVRPNAARVEVAGMIEAERLVMRVGPIDVGAQSADQFDVLSIVTALFATAHVDGHDIVIPVTNTTA